MHGHWEFFFLFFLWSILGSRQHFKEENHVMVGDFLFFLFSIQKAIWEMQEAITGVQAAIQGCRKQFTCGWIFTFDLRKAQYPTDPPLLRSPLAQLFTLPISSSHHLFFISYSVTPFFFPALLSFSSRKILHSFALLLPTFVLSSSIPLPSPYLVIILLVLVSLLLCSSIFLCVKDQIHNNNFF